MKITFSNLGSIKKTTLDLRPLTVIIGPNNSNKTYIAYSIYGIWRLAFRNNLNRLLVGFKFNKLDENTYSLLINDDFFDGFVNHLNVTANVFKLQLNNYFQDTNRRLFKNTEFHISITKQEIKNALYNLIDKSNTSLNPLEKWKLKLKKDVLLIEYDAESDTDDLFAIDVGEDFIPSEPSIEVILEILTILFPAPFLLPAERNAFIITYKMLANRRYKHLRQMQREINTRKFEERQIELLREQGDIRYPQPIEDFLDFLTDVELNSDIELLDEYSELADYIEKFIQNRNKTDFEPTKFGGREIKINVKKGLKIDLYNASSSIKQLAPLLLYLRYRSEENNLLIIDEPEMNLHPESQAKFLEVLGMLVNAGVNVLLTTHSPYFMSHLNNLVGGKTDDEKVLKEQAKSLYLGDERAFLKLEDVSAYEMKNNKLKDLKDKDYGIRWDTLSDVSADIQQKFFEIYEKGKETSAEDEV